DRAAGADPDLTAVRCELYRVRQQVEQDLLELALVCKDLPELRIGVEAERDAVPLCTLAYQRHRIGDRHRHVEGREVELHPPGLDLRKVEDVVDQLQQVLARRMDVLEVIVLL